MFDSLSFPSLTLSQREYRLGAEGSSLHEVPNPHMQWHLPIIEMNKIIRIVGDPPRGPMNRHLLVQLRGNSAGGEGIIEYRAKRSEGGVFQALSASKTASCQLLATGTSAADGLSHYKCEDDCSNELISSWKPSRGTVTPALPSVCRLMTKRCERSLDRWHAAESRLQAIEETGKRKLLNQAIAVLLTDEQRPGTPATFIDLSSSCGSWH
jgi:hypothetical protein